MKESSFIMSSDLDRLRTIIDLWQFIQEENDNHKSLVSESDWRNWQTYNDVVIKKLKTIILEFDGVYFSEDQRNYVNELHLSIKSARRESEEELQNQINALKIEDYNNEKQTLMDKIQ